MNTTEYLLSSLAEECAEVAQMCSKSARFGLGEVYDNTLANPEGHDNTERLVLEINDLFGVMQQMQEVGILPKHLLRAELINAKRLKIAKYMAYAKRLRRLLK